MDIGFTEEQELLRETARKFLDAECDSRFVRARMAERAAVTDEFWHKLAQQGWLGIVYPEADGGSGLGLVDLVVLVVWGKEGGGGAPPPRSWSAWGGGAPAPAE